MNDKDNKKIKIGIMTIYDTNNLGNRLQNFAMQEFLRDYDVDVHTFINYHFSKKTSLMRKTIKFIVQTLTSILNKFFFIGACRNKAYRKINFMKFNKKIQLGETIHANFDYSILNYDLFVAGSDQIWNSEFYNDLSNNMLFFSPNAKKIALSASVALPIFSLEKNKEHYVKYLKDFQDISVREQQHADYLEKLLSRKVECLIDPTLMLSKEQWNLQAVEPPYHKNCKFILLYFLGDLNDTYRQEISKVSSKYGLDIINVYDKNSKYYRCGPSEFIFLVSQSSLVFTDSFHGSVFAFIFDKPLKIFPRTDGKTMNSRLENLINKFSFENIFFNNEIDINGIMNADYSLQKHKLSFEQKKYRDFFEKKYNSITQQNKGET